MYQKPAMLTIVPKSNLVFVENNDEDYKKSNNNNDDEDYQKSINDDLN